MPTYEYVCRSCGHLFEVVQSMRDDPLTECPECGGVLRKVFAPPAIAFKGSGFYATDHGKKAPASEGDRGKTDTPAADTKGNTASPGKKEDAASDSATAASSPASSTTPATTKDATGS